mgnify:CR=1 FL=1
MLIELCDTGAAAASQAREIGRQRALTIHLPIELCDRRLQVVSADEREKALQQRGMVALPQQLEQKTEATGTA